MPTRRSYLGKTMVLTTQPTASKVCLFRMTPAAVQVLPFLQSINALGYTYTMRMCTLRCKTFTFSPRKPTEIALEPTSELARLSIVDSKGYVSSSKNLTPSQKSLVPVPLPQGIISLPGKKQTPTAERSRGCSASLCL